MNDLQQLCPILGTAEACANLHAVVDRVLDLPREQRAEFCRRLNDLSRKRSGRDVLSPELVREVVEFEE